MTTIPRVAIIGGGPGGLMLARLLQVRGVPAIVYESDLHPDHRPQGGSLDLHADSGLQAIRLAGLEREFLAHSRPEDQGDRLYDASGTLLFSHDGEGQERPEIDRTVLRSILLESLSPGVVRWGAKVSQVRANTNGYEIFSEAGTASYDMVVGADGAWSRVRPLLSDAVPHYEGVVFVELGFELDEHPFVGELAGNGKMFAVGDNRCLVAQRNGNGHIRCYAGWRTPEDVALDLTKRSIDEVRETLSEVFRGWAPVLTDMINLGAMLGVRPLYALPVGHRWTSRPALTLLGDAAHLMSPFAGQGVNLALADAADLAEALSSGSDWSAVTRAEAVIAARAEEAAEGSAEGLRATFSSNGVAHILEHYEERIQGQNSRN